MKRKATKYRMKVCVNGATGNVQLRNGSSSGRYTKGISITFAELTEIHKRNTLKDISTLGCMVVLSY